MRVGCGCPILERRVVSVIDAVTLSNAIHGRDGIEVRVEPSPRDILCIQEVADVFAGHPHDRFFGAIVIDRVEIGDYGSIDDCAGKRIDASLVSLSGQQV